MRSACDGEGEWLSNSTTPTNPPYAVHPACVRSLLTRTMVADVVRSDHSRRAQFSSALHTLSDGRVVRATPAKTCRRVHGLGIALAPAGSPPRSAHSHRPNNAKQRFRQSVKRVSDRVGPISGRREVIAVPLHAVRQTPGRTPCGSAKTLNARAVNVCIRTKIGAHVSPQWPCIVPGSESPHAVNRSSIRARLGRAVVERIQRDCVDTASVSAQGEARRQQA